MTENTERFEIRLSQKMLERIDEWGDKQGDRPSRSEAARRLIENSLSKSPFIDDGQKLIIAMLSDLLKSSNMTTEFEPDFIMKAICGGHYWALKDQHAGIYHGHADTDKDVSEVTNILHMWWVIESQYAKLSKADKNLLANKVGPLGRDPKFPGFDGNNEAKHLNIAYFSINELGAFPDFEKRAKNRQLNSHCPTLERYRKMLEIFEPMGRNHMWKLNAQQLIQLLSI